MKLPLQKFKYYIFILFISCLVLPAYTQKNALNVGMGLINGSTMLDAIYGNPPIKPVYNLEYQFYFSKYLFASANYGFHTREYNDERIVENSFLLGIGVRYLNLNRFQLTSGLYGGIINRRGIIHSIDEWRENKFDLRINAITLRYGGAFGGYAGLGFGSKGIFNFGLSYQF